MAVFLLRPNGREVMGAVFPNAARPKRMRTLGYDCRALRALAASRPTLNDPGGNRALEKNMKEPSQTAYCNAISAQQE